MTVETTRRSLRAAYETHRRLIAFTKLIWEQSPPELRSELKEAATRLRNAIHILCLRLPNGAILYPCKGCNRPWHIGNCPGPVTFSPPETLPDTVVYKNRVMPKGDE